MELRRPPDAAAPAWPPPRPAEKARHHAGSLHGAAATGEAARPHRAVRIGLWFDGAGRVEKARWRASDDAALRAAAEAACSALESRGAGPRALHDAGAGEGAEMVAAAVEAALLLADGR